jgi:thiosulfate reductase cytochrome b subunit
MSTTTNKMATKPGNRWARLTVTIIIAVVALAAVVLIAQWMRTLPAVKDFLTAYPGQVELPATAPVGLPAWLGWQHFLNAFFIVLIIRSGWLVRTTARPKEYWTRSNTGLTRTKGNPTKISLNLWFHLSLDLLWVLNGIVFIVLLFATGQWMRIMPTSWAVIPNAVSTAIQYASLNWPTENGWVNYNSLQVLAYFSIVFIAAPLALATGLRMSGAWPKNAATLNRIYPVEVARAIHFPVMLYFVCFVVVHVALVFTTGALHNLNHMYASNNGAGWTGFWIFAASVAAMVAAWLLARPLFLRPIASLTGKVGR